MSDRIVDDQVIKDAAFRLIAYRPRSHAELARRLKEKEFDSEQVERVVDELESKGYINDSDFALAYSRDQVKLRHVGPIVLKRKLIEFGINRNTIESTLSKVFSQFPIESTLELLLVKKNISPHQKIPAKELRKLTAFLQRKGYSWDQIQPVIQELNLKIEYE